MKNRRRTNGHLCGSLAILWLAVCFASSSTEGAEAGSFTETALPLLKKFCVECHGRELAEANVNLERMASEKSFATSYKSWQKVAAMLERKRMPPDDASQPTEAERQQLVLSVREQLRRVVAEQANNPGHIAMRRLTSAEYGYTIQDLTGLDLDIERDFVSDAVGGEGFTNVGSVQFVQDSTLERYLQAAKQVAAHAVIGAGPLQFYRDPGKTGLELSAIHRIQEIYRNYGFRTAAGEGGVPFGLDRYPKAFYVAWRYRHRDALGLGNSTLATLATKEHLPPRFAEHVWSVVNQSDAAFPTSEVVAQWRQLPSPKNSGEQTLQQAYEACEQLYQQMFDWQIRLTENVSDKEEAAVLSERSFTAAQSRSMRALLDWPEDSKTARIFLSVVAANPQQKINPVVVWKNPRVRFRIPGQRRGEYHPLVDVLFPEESHKLNFGKHPHGATIEPRDFVISQTGVQSFELPVPDGARGGEMLVDVLLDLEHGENCVVRCSVSEVEKTQQGKTTAALLADPESAAFQAWKVGVLEFARLLPQVSHREPAPSDRDPIPFPFDNIYNGRERDHFHYKAKYHRDDAFLVEKILDDAARKQLDAAWADLLGSFEYHDILLRFVAEKHKLDLGDRRVADIDDGWIDRQPVELRNYLQALRADWEMVQRRLHSAQSGHMADVLNFASRAWRRPLTNDEQDRLRNFYFRLTTDAELDHPQAIAALLTRVLTSPGFLYRAERASERAAGVALSDWELASRLSYFLWSSLPDEDLIRAAAAGDLRDPEKLKQQVLNMLRDPKARRLATEFFGQWFGFYQFDRYRGIDPQRFPEFTDSLKTALYDEAVSFFEHIIRQDRPVNDILFADYAFLNRSLAAHYAIDVSVEEHGTKRISKVNQFQRGGLLGLGAVLTVTSAPLRTSPVKRGDWILRRVLGTPVPPPPADAGSIPADDIPVDGLKTVRERLDKHRQQAACNNCHVRIDPLGFALENYDPIGRWRDTYRDGTAIDSSGSLSDGASITGPDGLKRYLKQELSSFHRTLCTKLVGYALGRGELVSDQQLIEQMTTQLASGGGRFSQLVEMIVTSPQFRYHQEKDGDAVESSRTSADGKDRTRGD